MWWSLTSECASTWLTPGQCPVLDEGKPEQLGWLVSEQWPHNVHLSSDVLHQLSHALLLQSITNTTAVIKHVDTINNIFYKRQLENSWVLTLSSAAKRQMQRWFKQPIISVDYSFHHSYSRRRKRERKYVENGKMLISSTRTGTVTEK